MPIADRMLDLSELASPVSAAGKLWRRLSDLHAVEENAALEVNPSARIWELPTKRQLRNILAQAFLASMEREEGRPVRALFEFASVVPGRPSRQDVILLDHPVPFCTVEVRRLAPAIDPATTSMLVRGSSAAPLEVWGLIHHGAREVNSVLVRSSAGLAVEVWDTGSLDLRLRGNLVYSFVRGRSILLGDASPKPVADLVGRVLHQADEPNEYAFHYGKAVARVAERILQARHGGAIFVSTTGLVPNLLTLRCPVGGPAAAGLGRMTRLARQHRVDFRIEWLRELPLTEIEIDGSALEIANHYRVERQYNAELDFVARLAAVDGAVLLDSQVNLLGFGAFFAGRLEAQSQVRRFRRGQQQGEYTDVARCGGTRHQSAVRFCQEHPAGAVAVVVSHDGGVSVAAKTGANQTTELHEI